MRTVDTLPCDVREEEHIWIPTSDGIRLSARIWRPVTSDTEPVPGIFEYIPYRKRDLTSVRDPYFAGHGYGCVRDDLRGTGDSEGVLADEYLEREQLDAEDVLAWIARPAVVHRQNRHDGHLVGRVCRAPGGGAEPAEPARHRHFLVHRRPLQRRHALHGRLPALGQPRRGGHHVREQHVAARPGHRRGTLAGDVAGTAGRDRPMDHRVTVRIWLTLAEMLIAGCPSLAVCWWVVQRYRVGRLVPQVAPFFMGRLAVDAGNLADAVPGGADGGGVGHCGVQLGGLGHHRGRRRRRIGLARRFGGAVAIPRAKLIAGFRQVPAGEVVNIDVTINGDQACRSRKQ